MSVHWYMRESICLSVGRSVCVSVSWQVSLRVCELGRSVSWYVCDFVDPRVCMSVSW